MQVRRRRPHWEIRDSSLCVKTCPPGRRAPRARQRSCAALQRRHRPPLQGRGPPPTIATSYSVERGLVWRPSRLASSRTCGRTNTCPSASSAGPSPSCGRGPGQSVANSGASGVSHLKEIWLRARKRPQVAQRCPSVGRPISRAVCAARRRCSGALQCARAQAR